jgi:hypothetical protein
MPKEPSKQKLKSTKATKATKSTKSTKSAKAAKADKKADKKTRGGASAILTAQLEPRPRRVIVEAVGWNGHALNTSVPFLPGYPASDNRDLLAIAVSVYDTAYSASILESEIGGPILGLTIDDFEVVVIHGLAGGVLNVRLMEVVAVDDFYRLEIRPRGRNVNWGAGHILLGISVYSRDRDVKGQTVCDAHVYRLPTPEPPPAPPTP